MKALAVTTVDAGVEGVPGEHLSYLLDELRPLAVEDQLVEGLLVLLLNCGLDGFVESLLLRSADTSLVDLTSRGRCS